MLRLSQSLSSSLSAPPGSLDRLCARWKSPKQEQEDGTLNDRDNEADDEKHNALGTAAWATKSDVHAHAYQTGDFWLSRSIDAEEVGVGFDDDRHVLLVGGSRGGKGTTVIVNNLCLWQGSAVVIDPKGENAMVTARRRGGGSDYCKGLGQKVHILDPFNIVKRDDDDFSDLKARFNPLDAIDPASEEALDDVTRLADAIVVVQAQNDPFWEESARTLIRGIILHVLTDPDYEAARNLVTVRKLIARGDWESVQLLEEAGEEEIPTGYELLFEGMRRNPNFDGVISAAGQSFGSMADKSPKTFESVIQVANRNTEFMDSPGMQRSLEASDFDLRSLKTDPKGVTLFLSLPQRFMNTHYRWLRLMTTLTITEMEQTRGKPATGHPILLLLDEFAGLKKMEIIENATAQIAGYGVKLFFIVQSLVQLKETYEKNWEIFLANAGLKLFFNVDDNFSRKYISEYLGETEVKRSTSSSSFTEGVSETISRSTAHGTNTSRSVASRSTGLFMSENTTTRSKGSNVSSTSSTSKATNSGQTSGTSEALHKRPLITPDEIGRFFARVDDKTSPSYPGLAISVASGQQPMVLRKANYYEDRSFRGYFDPHPDHPPPPKLIELKKQLLIEEKADAERRKAAEAAERQRAKEEAAAQRKADRQRRSEIRRARAGHLGRLIGKALAGMVALLLLFYVPAVLAHEVANLDGQGISNFSLSNAIKSFPYGNFDYALDRFFDAALFTGVAVGIGAIVFAWADRDV